MTEVTSQLPNSFSFVSGNDGVYLIDDNDQSGGDSNGDGVERGKEIRSKSPGATKTWILIILSILLICGGSLLIFTFIRHQNHTHNHAIDGGNETSPTRPPPTPPTRPPAPERCETPTCHKVGTEIKSFMDPALDPCDDFYHYACGGWINLHPPDQKYNATSALSQLSQDNNKVIRDMLESSEVFGGAEEKARDFYRSCIAKKNEPPTTTTPEPDYYYADYNNTDDYDADNYYNYTTDDDYLWSESISLLEKTFPNIRTQLKPILEIPDLVESNSQTCALFTTYLMPDFAARIFVQKTYSASKQGAIHAMLNSISKRYRSLISSLTWMESSTKAKILSHMSSTSYLIGYPESLLNTSAEIGNYAEISVSSSASAYTTNLLRLNDHAFWNFLNIPDVEVVKTVPQANAFYTYVTDQLVIPAGIALPPFFAEDHPPIVNWAKFATTLAHEYTHAFLEYLVGEGTRGGYQIPAGVGYSSWREFANEIRTCFEDTYASYPIINSSVAVNGNFTWDENISDVLGLQVAFEEFFANWQGIGKDGYKELPGLGGLSAKQVFFVAAAQVECKSFKSEEARQWALADGAENDPHSPNSVRVLGEMSNYEEFAKAFHCPVGSKYNPEKKCRVFY